MSAKRPRIDAARSAWRNRALVVALAVGALALEGKMLYLQLVDHDFLASQGELRHVDTVPVPAYRGPILDRRGEPLAVSTPVDTIGVNPRAIEPELSRVGELAEALDMDKDELLRRITSAMDRNFIYLRRHLAPGDAARVLSLDIAGVGPETEYRRYYPNGEVTSQVLGFTNIEDHGQEGLEYNYDHFLMGVPGSKLVLRDERGRVIDEVDLVKAPRPGGTLRTSLDLRLQSLAYLELKRAVDENHAEAGSAVILDPRTGEVLAMVNQPSLNPNDRAQRGDADRHRNRAVTDPFEPGSAFKPLVVAAALETGRFTPDQIIDTSPGYVEFGKARFRDSHNLGPITITNVLAHSSNVGAVRIGTSLEPRQLWTVLGNFGIGHLTDVALPGESFGQFDDYRHWQDVRRATISFGYGVSVTTVQLARAYSVIASGGLLRPLSIVMLDRPPPGERVLSKATATALTKMLEAVVSPQGTGTRAAVRNYRVAGKTGTTQTTQPGGYTDQSHNSIFVGFAPASDPAIVIAVVINEPGGDAYYGSDVAAPVFSRIATGALRTLAVPPDALEMPPQVILSQAQVGP